MTKTSNAPKRLDVRAEPKDEDFILRPYGGKRPPMPEWFSKAVETPFRTRTVNVEGADIVYQEWGDPSKPGLLLVHGNGAHSHWWDFIAPYLTGDWHVVAPNFSGMGDSAWREDYSFSTYIAEHMAVCEHAGLFETDQKPIIVAHSFGGFISLFTAMRHGERFAGAVIVDTHIEPPGQERPRPPLRTNPNRIYTDYTLALSRFRLAPLQPCANHYAVDHIARHSIRETTNEHGEPGFVWKFDPFIFVNLIDEWDAMALREIDPKCPITFMRGSYSALLTPEIADFMQTLQDPLVPMITIPEAHHHVMLDQPLAFVAALRGLLAVWPPRPA